MSDDKESCPKRIRQAIHEIRSPLNTISLWAESLRRDLPEKQREKAVSSIRASIRKAEAILEREADHLP